MIGKPAPSETARAAEPVQRDVERRDHRPRAARRSARAEEPPPVDEKPSDPDGRGRILDVRG
jgi:hypothetical protein